MEKPFWKFDKRFDRYLKIGAELFEMTSNIVEADLVVLPADWGYYLPDHKFLAEQLANAANEYGKKIVIFFRDDRECDVEILNSIVLKTSLYRSKRKNNEYALTAWSGDFIDKYLDGVFPIRPKTGKPTVSFCGYSDGTKELIDRCKIFIKNLWHPADNQATKYLRMRQDVLDQLSLHDGVKTNFPVRDGWYGGTIRNKGKDENLVYRARVEYVKNMIQGDYVLTIRGKGNYSFRLYETLSCGRIPLFINTDCVLPFDFEIDWKQFCVWIDWQDWRKTGDILCEFHQRINDRQFEDLQRQCRQLYKTWVSPEGFFSHLHHYLAFHNAQNA